MSRRPVTAAERPQLLALGCRLRQVSNVAGLSQVQLAEMAGIHPQTLSRIERGVRRTRRSTLERLAPLLASDPASIVEQLVALAGPALAPESPYADRIARRRLRRSRKREVARQREQYRREREALEREWAERTARHLEFRALVRLVDKIARRWVRLEERFRTGSPFDPSDW